MIERNGWRGFLAKRGIDQIAKLDYETFYGPGYSLRSQKLSTTQYVRDPRFKAHGVGLGIGESRIEWIVHEDIPTALSRIDWSRTALLAHNTAFDGLVSSHHYGIVPAYYFDTMSMARGLFSHTIGAGLDELAHYFGLTGKVKKDALEATKGIRDLPPALLAALGGYCIDDVDDMWSIFVSMIENHKYPFDELDLIHHTIKAYADPVIQVDHALAGEALEEAKLERHNLFLKTADLLGLEASEELRSELIRGRLSSNTSFAGLLREHGAEPLMKTTKSGRRNYAFARADILKAKAEENCLEVLALYDARLAVKSKQPPGDVSDLVHIGTDDELRATLAQTLLGSADQFAEALKMYGVEPPQKISPATGEDAWAFAKDDLDFQALQEHPDEDVRTLCEARLAVKSSIGVTRAERFLDHGKAPWALPILLNYAKAHTLRWSGGDKMNPQNFVRGGKLRRAMRAPEGHKILAVDSGQIEARFLAWLAGEEKALQEFRDSDAGLERDRYCRFGDKIFGYPINADEHPNERFASKVGVLGLGFGMAWERYQRTLKTGAMGRAVDVSDETAQLVVKTFRNDNPRIKILWRVMQGMLSAMYEGHTRTLKDGLFVFGGDEHHNGYVVMPNGLELHYPSMRCNIDPIDGRKTDFEYWNGKNYTRIYGGLFTENVVQSGARIVVGEQILKIAEHYRVGSMTHDEGMFIVLTRLIEQAYEFALECFATPSAWCLDLPVIGEAAWDDFYPK